MEGFEREGLTTMRNGCTIYPAQEDAIEKLLAEFMQQCPARFALLTDTSGLVITAHGERGAVDLIALASLVAGDTAASQEIARLTGQYQNYQLVLREGTKTNTFIVEAGRFLVLFVQVSMDIPLGWARLLIRETGRQCAEIIATPPDEIEELKLGLDGARLSDMIGESLDSMWTG
jgi:predicted regulator of Ras-like GTPase activity (Roadblock/LC7/MglB family)